MITILIAKNLKVFSQPFADISPSEVQLRRC